MGKRKPNQDPRHAFWLRYRAEAAEEDLLNVLDDSLTDVKVLVALRKRAAGDDGPIVVKVHNIEDVGRCITVVDSEFDPISPMEQFSLPVGSLDYPYLEDEWLDANCATDVERTHAVELHKALTWKLGRGKYAQRPQRNQSVRKHHKGARSHPKGKGGERQQPAPQVPEVEAKTVAAPMTAVALALQAAVGAVTETNTPPAPVTTKLMGEVVVCNAVQLLPEHVTTKPKWWSRADAGKVFFVGPDDARAYITRHRENAQPTIRLVRVDENHQLASLFAQHGRVEVSIAAVRNGTLGADTPQKVLATYLHDELVKLGMADEGASLKAA